MQRRKESFLERKDSLRTMYFKFKGKNNKEVNTTEEKVEMTLEKAKSDFANITELGVNKVIAVMQAPFGAAFKAYAVSMQVDEPFLYIEDYLNFLNLHNNSASKEDLATEFQKICKKFISMQGSKTINITSDARMLFDNIQSKNDFEVGKMLAALKKAVEDITPPISQFFRQYSDTAFEKYYCGVRDKESKESKEEIKPEKITRKHSTVNLIDYFRRTTEKKEEQKPQVEETKETKQQESKNEKKKSKPFALQISRSFGDITTEMFAVKGNVKTKEKRSSLTLK